VPSPLKDDAESTKRLMPRDYKARASQVILLKINAWDANCPLYIPQRVEAATVAAALEERDQRIAALEAQLAQFRATLRRESTFMAGAPEG
jgi:predicted pyridoxine 5'-phosphate oxidase superfamily flavin-nucleotide-binding protein